MSASGRTPRSERRPRAAQTGVKIEAVDFACLTAGTFVKADLR